MFTKNHERLLAGDVARAFLERILAEAGAGAPALERAVVEGLATPPAGTTDRDAVVELISRVPASRRVTLGADKGDTSASLSPGLREMVCTRPTVSTPGAIAFKTNSTTSHRCSVSC